MLLHRLVRGRTRLGLPYIWGIILHMQIPRAGKLGAGNIMAVWMVEPDRSDCWSRFYRVRLCPVTLGGSLNGR